MLSFFLKNSFVMYCSICIFAYKLILATLQPFLDVLFKLIQRSLLVLLLFVIDLSILQWGNYTKHF